MEGDEEPEVGQEYYEDAQVDVDQIEQEEVVVTAEAPGDEQPGSSQQSPKKDAANKEENINVV